MCRKRKNGGLPPFQVCSLEVVSGRRGMKGLTSHPVSWAGVWAGPQTGYQTGSIKGLSLNLPTRICERKAWEINWSPLTCSGYFCSELFWHHDLMAWESQQHKEHSALPAPQPPCVPSRRQKCGSSSREACRSPGWCLLGSSAPCRPSVVLKSLFSRHKVNCLGNHL